MQRWPEEVYEYITEVTRFEDPILREMEERAERDGFPIISPLVGPWLYLFARLTGARRIWELGSGFGYSTWYFARALEDNGGGTVTHTVWDNDLSKEARDWLERAGLLRYCEFKVSEAVLALTEETAGIDLIFMDIDKEGYDTAVDVIEQKLKPGGLLLTDNVIWSGKVTDPEADEESTVAIRAFNNRLGGSDRWEYVMNPLRDGLGIARFRG